MADPKPVGRLRHANDRTMPPVADSVSIHYVGFTAVGEVQMASVSILQKPLLHLYSEFLKSGGCTNKKTRQLLFTENGVRVVSHSQDNASSEQFFHYALITYTNAVILRTFKSHGKKIYGMFEPLSPLPFTSSDRPDTLFPLEKRFLKMDNIPIFPLLTLLYRPDPPNNHLHCHTFACLSLEQAKEIFNDVKTRVRSFFEDYETLSVDDNMFSTPIPDFWKLTEDGWRMTMTRKKRRTPQTNEEASDGEDEEPDEEQISTVKRQSRDLAVFAQAKVLNRRVGGSGPLFADNVPTSDSGVESPTAENSETKKTSPRSSMVRPRYVRNGVRVLPPAPSPHNKSAPLSSPGLTRRRSGPPVAQKPSHRIVTETPLPVPGPQPKQHASNDVVNNVVTSQQCNKLPDRASSESAKEKNAAKSKPVRKLGEVGNDVRVDRPLIPSFVGPILLTRPQTLLDEHNKRINSREKAPKENEIEFVLSGMEYTEGIDGIEWHASMMNFERSLGYLP